MKQYFNKIDNLNLLNEPPKFLSDNVKEVLKDKPKQLVALDKLIEEFEKKKNRKIKFEKIAPFKYKYGSQNVVLNLDQNNQIFIKFYNGLISLEKYTEVNERIEECKLKSNNYNIFKSLNNSNEFKKKKKQKH